MQYIAWPAVVLVLGLVAIFTFRKSIERLIDRTRKVGRAGIEAGSGPQEGGVVVQPSPADQFLKQFDNALLVQREGFIRAELERLGINQPSQRERVLIRLLAALSVVQAFERAYILIWGSQIAALQFLNSAGAEGVSVEFLRPWYDQAAAREPVLYDGYAFESWLGFLQTNLLVGRRDGNVFITLEGREFLKYLLDQGYSLHKMG